MKPTAKLRFVKKTIKIDDYTAQYNNVLQQWYGSDDYTDQLLEVNGEWRDVPTEIEPCKP